jgi:hypothetical protein
MANEVGESAVAATNKKAYLFSFLNMEGNRNFLNLAGIQITTLESLWSMQKGSARELFQTFKSFD